MVLSITVPVTGDLLIKIGDNVDFSTPLVNKNTKKEVKIPLARALHINPKKIFTVLSKFVGDSIKKGDVVAVYKTFLGKNKYVSEHDGTLKEVNHVDGTIILEIDSDEKTQLNAFFKGEIVEIDTKTHKDKSVIHFKVKNAKHFAMKDAIEFFGGPIFYNSGELSTVTDETVNGYVVCAQSLLSYEQIKLETLGAKGFILLHSLPEHAHIPHAKIRELPDWDELHALKLPYCTIDLEQGRMYVYE